MIEIEKVSNGYIVKVPESDLQTSGSYVFANLESAFRFIREHFENEKD